MRKFKLANGDSFSSFLEAVSNNSFSIKDLNRKAVIEFLTFGALYFEETFFENVSKQFSHQKYNLHPYDGFVSTSTIKNNPLVDKEMSDPVEAFLAFFEKRATYLRDRKISLDLTGGIDSRLVSAVFYHFDIPFDVAFSLDSGDKSEEVLAREVAEKLGKELHVLQSANIDSDESLEELFVLSDGLWDVLKLKSLRNTQHWRKEQGYDLVITGVGGELYKDFFWQQDFPFYEKKTSNLRRLVDTRMYPFHIDVDWFGLELKGPAKNLRSNFLKKLSKYNQRTNTRTYDQIYYNVRIKEHLSVFSHTTVKHFTDVYTPLLEDELLTIGYNLPRKMRFFNNFHRMVITKINPEIAQIPTTEGGISCSSKPIDILKDVSHYIRQKSGKVLSRVKGEGTSERQKRSNRNGYLAERIEESAEILKRNSILSDSFPSKTEEIPEPLQGRLLTLGLLLKQID